jgi:hypothetical protein
MKLWGYFYSLDESLRPLRSADLKLEAAELFTSSSSRKQFVILPTFHFYERDDMTASNRSFAPCDAMH